MYSLDILPSAANDLTDIAVYITYQLKNKDAAKRVVNEILNTINSLATFPYSHTLHKDNFPLRHEYRKAVVLNYLVFYYVSEPEKRVIVSGVIYAKRNLSELLEDKPPKDSLS